MQDCRACLEELGHKEWRSGHRTPDLCHQHLRHSTSASTAGADWVNLLRKHASIACTQFVTLSIEPEQRLGSEHVTRCEPGTSVRGDARSAGVVHRGNQGQARRHHGRSGSAVSQCARAPCVRPVPMYHQLRSCVCLIPH